MGYQLCMENMSVGCCIFLPSILYFICWNNVLLVLFLLHLSLFVPTIMYATCSVLRVKQSNITDYEYTMIRNENRCFWTTISSRFSKQPSYGINLYWFSLLIISLNLYGITSTGPFIIRVVKLHSYRDSYVRNLCKFKYFNKYFRHSRVAWNTI